MWERQGTQITHVNVLDLDVFPKIPLCNCHLIWSLRGIQVAREENIRKRVAKIWKELPS